MSRLLYFWVQDPFKCRPRVISKLQEHFGELNYLTVIVGIELRLVFADVQIAVERVGSMDRSKHWLSSLAELHSFIAAKAQDEKRCSVIKCCFRSCWNSVRGEDLRDGPRIGKIAFDRNSKCSCFNPIELRFLCHLERMSCVLLCFRLPTCELLAQEGYGKCGDSKAGLSPRGPFTLGNAKRTVKPAAIVDWIRHITSPVFSGAIVCGGNA